MKYQYELKADTSKVDALVSKLNDLYESNSVVIDNFFKTFPVPFTISQDILHVAGGASKILVYFEPTDSFVEFVAALSAGKLNGLTVEV